MFKSYFSSPIGFLEIISDKYYVYEINFSNSKERNDDEAEIAPIIECKKQLFEYFEGKRKLFDFPIAFQGTSFQEKVWKELRKIPYGETRTYGEIAESLGDKNACRAVGGANNKNKLPIVFPCHRVIAKEDIGGICV